VHADSVVAPPEPSVLDPEIQPEHGAPAPLMEERAAEDPEPESRAVDTHCHLYLVEGEVGPMVAAAREAGVGKLICVGIDPDSSRRSLELAESFRGVLATAGMHPHTASDMDRRAGSAIEELLADRLVIGVGETGLDYYRRLSPVDEQQDAFRTHIALSRETGKPVIVHVRDAWDDAMRILSQEGAERVVLHCFSGDERVAAEAAARGYFVSFAGNLTYPGADALRRAAATLAADRILCETDTPFLPPQGARGTPNAPANVIAVLEQLAEVRGVNLHQMTAETTANARSAFPLLP
jgi:TatD DNase family protein